ncbi:MAG TPA: hypothetical protein VGD17_19990 [Chitinophagaceae bacterium]
MEQIRKLILAGFIVSICGCEKVNNEKAIKHKEKCEVEQFNSYHSQFDPDIPYLFRKNYDPAGRVKEIDAYFWGIARTPLHFRASIRYKGLIVQFIDADKPQDTLMTLWINSKGRPVKALENIAMYKGRGGPFQGIQHPLKYDFSYKDDKLWVIKSDFTDFISIDTCKYDESGNILSMVHEPTNPQGDLFRYDLSREANQQFYMDLRELNSFLTGFNLLLYLQYFPELTSPPNVRTSHHVGLVNPPIGSFRWLFNHQFDNDRKLIRYDLAVDTTYLPDIRTCTVIWRCNKSNQDEQ